MSFLRIDLNCADAQLTMDARLLQRSNDFRNNASQLGEYLEGISAGVYNFTAGRSVTGATQASGTVTLASFAAADTVTINGVVFTASASPAGAQQFLSTGGDTAVAAALVAKLNASTAPAKVVNVISATSSGAVITVKCVVPGLIGNLCTLAISAHGSVSGANLTGGTEGTVTTY